MAKTLDIKRLVKGMSLQDKAKILFADRNKKAETSGFERLLTPEEEDAIIEDARKYNQIGELNKLNDFYLMANLLLADIQTAYLNFWLSEYKLEQILTAIFVGERAKDVLYQIIYDFAKGDKEKAKELEKKYIDELYLKTFLSKHLTSFWDKDSEVNMGLQRHLIDAIERLKKYKKIRYQLDYVVNERASIDFLSDKQKQNLKEHDNALKRFVDFGETLAPLKMLKDVFIEHKTIGDLKVSQEFFNIVKNTNKAVRTTIKDKEEAREQIDDILNRKNI